MKTNLQKRVENSTQLNGVKRAIKLLGISMVAVMTTFTACTDYDNSLNNAEDRLENVEQTIPTINQQIESINTSINNLKELKTDLNSLSERVKALEDEDDNINQFIEDLKKADETLSDNIEGLQTYVNGDFKDGIEAWVNTTFATLEQYETLQRTIADISGLIEKYKNDITEAYTKDIEEAIAASEESMKSWINEMLTEGYYDIAQIDQMIDDLESSDEYLQQQIDAQQQALEEAKEELTNAYKDAIREVIEENNGVITEAIAEAVQNAMNELNTNIDTINSAIGAIQAEIETLKKKINTIDGQIEGINKSINDLKATDIALNEYIKSLEKQINDNKYTDLETKELLNGYINELRLKDMELDQKISNLLNYVNQDFKDGIEEWANTTFATLEQYQTMQSTIAEIRVLIDTYKSDITEAYTKDIEDAIAASEESMKSWVNETLAEGYYNTAEVDAKLSALETADANLLEQINAQKQALEEAVQELTTAYQTAINEAIATNNGIIDNKISAAIQNVTEVIDAQLLAINNTITSIQQEIETIKNNIATIEEQIEDLNDLIEELDGKLNNLGTTNADIINEIQAQQQALEQIRTDLTNAYEAAIKRAIEENNGVINAEIAEAIKEALADVESRLNTLETAVAEIENIKNSIATIEEQIEGLNDLIEELEGKLNNLETTDSDIINEIRAQQQALEQIRTDLTNAYEAAIKRAIEENNGVINTEIAEAMQEVLTEVENRLDNLRGTIDNIENELAALKENFASRIQSIRFLPEYNDGMVMFSTSETTADVSFIISPSNLATVIANAHSDATPVITAWISRTQSTRAVDMPVALTVTSVEGSDSGLLIVGVDISSLADGYWDSFQSANMFIRIQDGNNDVISEMIPVGFKNE